MTQALNLQKSWSSMMRASFFVLSLVCIYQLQNLSFVDKTLSKKQKENSIWFDLIRSTENFPGLAHFLTFGSTSAASDFYWIQSLQATEPEDECAQDKQKQGCHSTFSSLTNIALHLDSRNVLAARAGVALADVVIKDIEGGSEILELSLPYNQNDMQLAYRAGYHYLYEVGDEAKAADMFQRAAQLGAPYWVYSLAAKLYSQSGKVELARRYLQEEIVNATDQRYIERLQQRLAQIEQKYNDRRPASKTTP